MFIRPLNQHLSGLCVISGFLLLTGCGDSVEEAAAPDPAEFISDSEQAKPDIVLDPVDAQTLQGWTDYVFPDGTRLSYPSGLEVMFSAGRLILLPGPDSPPDMTVIHYFPAQGESDPGAAWIIRRMDELLPEVFNRVEQTGQTPPVRVQTPHHQAVLCRYTGVNQQSGETIETSAYVAIVNDRVFSVATAAPNRSLAAAKVLCQNIAVSLKHGEPIVYTYDSDDPYLLGTFQSPDLRRGSRMNPRENYYQYSFHPDGRFFSGDMREQTLEPVDSPDLTFLQPKAGQDDPTQRGQWRAEEGELTLTWESKLIQRYRYQVSNSPYLELLEHEPPHRRLAMLNKGPLPGAPIIDEEATNTAPTNPAVDTPSPTPQPAPANLLNASTLAGIRSTPPEEDDQTEDDPEPAAPTDD